MVFSRFLFFFFSFFLSLDALATHQIDRFIIAGRFGWSWAEVGESQYVELLNTNPAPDYFDTHEKTSSRPLFGAFAGAEFPFYRDNMRWQTGLAYYVQTHSFQTEGIDYTFSLPDFGNSEYSYSIRNQRMMFENKFLYGFTQHIFGYLLGGIGASFNKAYDYHTNSLDSTVTTSGEFATNTTASFSYSIGTGVEMDLVKNVRCALGYQFSELGKVSLGDYTTGSTNETISKDNTPAQEIIFQLGYFF